MRLVVVSPFLCVWFGTGSPDHTGAPKPRVVVWPDRRLWMPYIGVARDGRVVAARRLFRIALPGRPLALPGYLARAAAREQGEICVGLVDSSHLPFDLRESKLVLPLSGP